MELARLIISIVLAVTITSQELSGASIGSYDSENISGYSDESIFSQIGKAVGRLDVMTDKGTFPCTAFIVSKRHLLTTYFCSFGMLDNERIGATRIDAVQFVAGYTQTGIDEGTKKFTVIPAPVEFSAELDYAVLEVIGDPSQQYGELNLTNALPNDGDPLWLIGHPMGEGKRVSRKMCRASVSPVSGHKLFHTCDTKPGNAGSPVIDTRSHEVVALHYGNAGSAKANIAILMSEILKNSKLLKASSSQKHSSSQNTVSEGTHAILELRAELAAVQIVAERANTALKAEVESGAETQKNLSKEKAISAKARREIALLNQQVAALRTQLQNLQGLLDNAMAKDIAEEVQLQNLGSQLNSALARVAAEERKRRRFEEAERKRLEREALELQGRTEQLSYQAKDLEKYRSEFFGRLRDVLGQQEGVRIVGDRFVFSSEILFSPAGIKLSDEGKKDLAKAATILKSVANRIPEEINWVIRVDGHSDDSEVMPRSRFKDNWQISQARALAVVRYFTSTLDIPPDRLAANSFGEYHPVNTENTPEARAQNRRIELKLTEK